MKKLTYLAAASLIVFAVACKKDKKEAVEETNETKVETTTTESSPSSSTSNTTTFDKAKLTVQLEAKSDSDVKGTAVFSQSESGVVTMVALVTGLDEGTHAIHLHEKSDCSSADGKSTGGHWNPTAQPHGKWGDANGYHKGDIGNFTANEKGRGTITHITNEWCIGCGDPKKDITGKAVIVHQGTDDFTSQPSGAAGSRVSLWCSNSISKKTTIDIAILFRMAFFSLKNTFNV